MSHTTVIQRNSLTQANYEMCSTIKNDSSHAQMLVQTWLQKLLIFFLDEGNQQFEVSEDQTREGGWARGG